MIDSLIEQTLKLKSIDERASYFVAKELALIEVNMLWFPQKNEDTSARLKSLAQHVKLTFKTPEANELAAALRTASSKIN